MLNAKVLRPEPITLDAFESCLDLLKGYRFKPYGHYANMIAEESLKRFFLERVSASLIGYGYSALWIPDLDGVQGLAVWTPLGWDSQQLGVTAGRLDFLIAPGDYDYQYTIKEALLTSVLGDCVDHGIQHLSTRIHASDLSSIHLLEKYGFVVVDGILTFSLDVRYTCTPVCPEDFEIRLSEEADIEQIKSIARSSYSYDRFHADPRIPRRLADELHAAWLQNSCLGKAADAVIVAAANRQILGFATCKIDRQTTECLGKTIGTIVLVATAAQSRARGVAKAITYGALDWFRAQAVDIVEVGTQIQNIPASRLYEACGFRLVASSLSLRRWIDHA